MATLERQNPQVKWCTLPTHSYKNRANPPQLQRNMWVELLEQLNPLSHSEALLLCQKSDTEWIAWIPDHGEATLRVDEFCCPVF
jgi:hypothetical protein